MDRVLFRVKVTTMAYWTVAIPLISLLICFCTSMHFQHAQVTTTICKVYNFLPSVSAITGISPQRYVWRAGVALYTGPRLLLAALLHPHYKTLSKDIPENRLGLYTKLNDAARFLHWVEALCLVGVTYVSNKENYPIHEKLFCTFMAAALSYMLVTCGLVYLATKSKKPAELIEKSLRVKCSLVGTTLLSSAGMLYFFYQHRMHCIELAFTWFSLCEYIISGCNMAFHLTIVYDLPHDEIVVGALTTPCDDDAITHNNVLRIERRPGGSAGKLKYK